MEGAICNPAYNRAGCRTPMQWDDGPNAGFSTADPSQLYLPVDPDPARPTVAAQEHDPDSTLNLVRRLIALRKATPALGTRAERPCCTTATLRVPPRETRTSWSSTHAVTPRTFHAGHLPDTTALLADGVAITGDIVQADGFGYGVFALSGG